MTVTAEDPATGAPVQIKLPEGAIAGQRMRFRTHDGSVYTSPPAPPGAEARTVVELVVQQGWAAGQLVAALDPGEPGRVVHSVVPEGAAVGSVLRVVLAAPVDEPGWSSDATMAPRSSARGRGKVKRHAGRSGPGRRL